jgi:methionyl-tRNA synthetase
MLTTLQPWASPTPTKAIVYAYETLRISGILLQPVMPFKAGELLDRLGVSVDQRGWEQCGIAERPDVGRIVAGLKSGKQPGHLFPPVK